MTPIAGRLGDMYGRRRVTLVLLVAMVAGSLGRRIGARLLLASVAGVLLVVYAVAVSAPRTVPSIFFLMVLIGIGIAFGFAASPLLIMEEVAPDRGREWHQRADPVGSTLAATVVGAVLAASSTSIAGNPVPSAVGFTTVFAIAGFAASLTLAIALCIPRTSYPDVGPEQRDAPYARPGGM